MRVYGLQLDLAWQDPEENHRRVALWLDREKIPAGSVVVLPEMFATGFSQKVAKVAEPEDGPTKKFLQEQARLREIYLLGGRAVEAADGKGANEALFFDPAGKEVLRYRKRYPFRFAGEHKTMVAGDSFPVLNIGKFTVGVAICYDLRFPELFREGVKAGVDFFIVPANWPAARAGHWRLLLQARAVENQAYVFGVNRVGQDPKVGYSGGSLLVDPKGAIVAEAGNTTEVLEGTLDHSFLTQYRQEFPALEDMR